MSAEDRDPKFERALAQHLRDGSTQAACPDAETLAAYHERSLSLEEMAHWKQHIVGCAVCQETLSLLEVTEKQLAEAWEEQPIAVLAAAGGETAAKARAAKEETLAALPVSSAPVSMTRKRRPVLMRWAIPLGAVAAGVLVWIGIHEQSALRPKAPADSVQVAKNLPQAVPPAASPYDVAPKSEVPAEQSKEGPRFDAQLAQRAPAPVMAPAPKGQVAPGTDDFRVGDTLRRDVGLAKKAPAAPATPAATGGIAAGAAATPPPPQPAAAAKEQVPNAVTETVEVASQAPPVNKTGKQPVDLPGGQAGGNAVQDQKRVAAMSNSKSAGMQYSDATTDAMMMSQGINGRSVSSLQMLTSGTVVIRTPDNKVWWKLGPGGFVELTTDAGKKWKTMDTSAGAQLTNGSAPSSKVFWIAGQSGTLLLTKDRGSHWTKLTTPIAGDLGGVHAADAKHATIWDTANRLSYETSDGGTTWKQTANE